MMTKLMIAVTAGAFIAAFTGEVFTHKRSRSRPRIRDMAREFRQGFKEGFRGEVV